MIGFKFTLAELKSAIRAFQAGGRRIKDREALHNKMSQYQRKRWMENLYDEGTVYGPWEALHTFTNDVRLRRGIRPGQPILYQIKGGSGKITKMGSYLRRQKNPRGGGGGQLHAWVKENILDDIFIAQGDTSSTLWQFKTTGAHDGSYAVYHDTGYTTGSTSLYPNHRVNARRLFSGGGGDNQDADEYQKLTEAYIDRVLGGI